MNETETVKWVLSWWQSNGLLAQAEEMIDGVSLFASPSLRSGEETPGGGETLNDLSVVQVEMRVEVPPSMIDSYLERFVLRPAGSGLDREAREREEREIVMSLHGAMKRLRARIENEAARQVAEIGPAGPGPGIARNLP